MTTATAPTVKDVSAIARAIIRREAVKAAGDNTLLSRDEERTAPPAIQQLARTIRANRGAGARVTVDALDEQANASIAKLIGSVNQSGRGSRFLSKAEAAATARANLALGTPVQQASQIASGHGLDVDAIATARVMATLDPTDPELIYKAFATVEEAENYRDPNGFRIAWLVPGESTQLTKTFTSGRNDLWAQRFEIDRVTGAIAILAEH